MQQLSLCPWLTPCTPCPLGLGVQGVSLFVQSWTGSSHAFNATKLLKVITFDRFHIKNPYGFEHSSSYITVFSQSTWGSDQPQNQLPHFQPQNLLGHPKGKILIPGPTWVCATIITLHLAHPLHTLPFGAGCAGGEPFCAILDRQQPCF